ncbi:MAG: hypothetical protein AAF871_13120 [Pseudomonadota bacterium]
MAIAPEWMEDAAFFASKKNQQSETKKRTPNTEKKKRPPASATKKKQSSDVRGLDAHLELIGDGEGQDGFNAPIYSALCSYFGRHGADAPVEPILDKVTQAIANAERDPSRDRSKYDDEDYLLEQAEKAREFIQDQPNAMADDPLEDYSTDGIKAALADASINQDSDVTDIEAILRRCLDGGADAAARARITDALVEVTPLGKRELNRLWNPLVKEETARQREAKQPSESDAINTSFGFDLVFSEALKRLHAANIADPFLFGMRDELFECRQTPNGPKLKLLDYDGLSEVISRRIKFEKTESDSTISTAPPMNVVKHIFHRDRADYALPLVAISEVPFFDRDGNLVDENGYDAGSGIYLAMPEGFVLPRVSEVPSEDELDRAFDAFIEVFGEFPFDAMTPDEIATNQSASFANTIGLACLPFMRAMIDGPTPGHLVNKPTPGTGAGLVLFILHMIWTGRKPIVMNIPKRQEEIAKTLIAKLRSGAFVVIFDNIPKNLDSDDLATAVSEGVLDARVFGRNDAGATDPVEVTTVWVFTGNNVTMSNELLRRMTLIDLDAQTDEPEKRTFTKSENELKAWVRDNRGELVWACLTLIQNWIASGRQPFKSELVKGTFSEWLAAVGGMMQAADIHHHFYANEDKLREVSSSSGSDATFTLSSVLSDYPPGHVFYVGGSDPSSIMNILNKGPDGGPIPIPSWGYSDEDGAYHSANAVGHHFKKYARSPHKARRTFGEDYLEVEIGFEREYDAKQKVHTYRIKFRALGTREWIESATDKRWSALIDG